MGYKSLFTNNSGYSNTAIGWSSLSNNVTGYRNTAVGHASLQQNSSGFYNTAVGELALSSNSIGNGNCAIGTFALSVATNRLNTALGFNAGGNVSSGTNLVLLGYDANRQQVLLQMKLFLEMVRFRYFAAMFKPLRHCLMPVIKRILKIYHLAWIF